MRKAIVTRSDGNIKEITDITHPLFRKYARKWQTDFLVFDHSPTIKTWDNRPHFRILKAKELNYDRILFLDSDMLITPLCPNPFEIVPENKIGTIFEDKGSRTKERHRRIKKIQSMFGNVGWKKGYGNAGTFVISKQHLNIFDPVNGDYYTEKGSVDVHVGYKIRELGFQIHELSFKWNHMTMFSEKWNHNANRFDSYIIHYAGTGVFEKGLTRLEQIKKDYVALY